MSAQHTAGPWVFVESAWDITTVYAPGGETVADCLINGLVTEDTQDEYGAVMAANARLIAAAPELLKLAYQYQSDLRHPPTADSVTRRLERIAAVLAKAGIQ